MLWFNRKACHSCAHFKKAPLAGKGWCKHPKLVAEPMLILVAAGKLSCAQPLGTPGDHWESKAARRAAPLRSAG